MTQNVLYPAHQIFANVRKAIPVLPVKLRPVQLTCAEMNPNVESATLRMFVIVQTATVDLIVKQRHVLAIRVKIVVFVKSTTPLILALVAWAYLVGTVK